MLCVERGGLKICCVTVVIVAPLSAMTLDGNFMLKQSVMNTGNEQQHDSLPTDPYLYINSWQDRMKSMEEGLPLSGTNHRMFLKATSWQQGLFRTSGTVDPPLPSIQISIKGYSAPCDVRASGSTLVRG